MPRLTKQYLVIGCTTCGRLLLAISEKKSRMCPYCGKRVRVDEASVVARSENPKLARQALQEAKTRSQAAISSEGKAGR